MRVEGGFITLFVHYITLIRIRIMHIKAYKVQNYAH
jgi:hypothetical protein